MTEQASTTYRNALVDLFESTWGASPNLEIRSGGLEATPATADSGTLLCTLALPSDNMAAASGGVGAKNGTWSGTVASAAGAGTVCRHWRLKTSGGTVVYQGTIGQAVALTTSASTAANGNVCTFASVPGTVVTGMKVSGTGIPAGCRVVATSGTTVTLSHTSTAGVSSGAALTFAYDITIDNETLVQNQQLAIATWQITAPLA
jgi:hypothetical protein